MALLEEEPTATGLAHLLRGNLMPAVAAGEVFSTLAVYSDVDPERVEAVLRALGVTIVDLPASSARHFATLRRADNMRSPSTTGGVPSGIAPLADLCILAFALDRELSIITGSARLARWSQIHQAPHVVLYHHLDPTTVIVEPPYVDPVPTKVS